MDHHKVVNETTDKLATVYQIDNNGRKCGYFRQSVWNSAPKFILRYDGQLGMQHILRPPDVVAEMTYCDDVLHGPWSITRQFARLNSPLETITRDYVEGYYNRGKKDGFEREYSYVVNTTEGQLIREAHYHDGKLDGFMRRFDPYGCLLYSAYFIAGVKHGAETSYASDGGITRLDTWSNGRHVVA